MTTTRTALRFTKTHSGRYAATAGGYRFIVKRVNGGPGWELLVQRTMLVVDVEVADPDHRADWHEFETKRDAVVIANEFHALADEELGIRSRFSVAISRGYDKIIEEESRSC